MELVIRRAAADDFDAWFELFEQVAAEGRWIGREGRLDRANRREAFERTLVGDEACTFVALRGEELVAVLGVTITAGLADFGMMVRDKHRGSRVGSALMARLIDWCREHGVHKVTLTLWPHNERAIGLYRKFELRG